ncbi:hypothetical protein FVO59_11825 [Microbacterium esteraromaticum]|uniref:HNH nuclease domain-containing protein n=1 Tax=Microbacterium esteraromaticum TaxID=57043 RepID=A0A7D7WF09_9MICO|nr:HNH endonuclease [Microbacterium esteraromaticum]QMU97817.1 hypothetical protein FVO59_11825 [Microbacterium esteraromaticum]
MTSEKSCACCQATLTSVQIARELTFCSKSCAIRSRSARFRGEMCEADGCERYALARGYCGKHYQRLRSTGKATAAEPWRDQTEEERFWSKVSIGAPNECWEWQGERNNKGYGRFAIYDHPKRTRRLAHRYALATTTTVDACQLVLHACDNPPCCNPNHLRVGTQLENMRDALAKGRMNMSGLELAPSRGTTKPERARIRAAMKGTP